VTAVQPAYAEARAAADVAEARRKQLDESGGRAVHVIADN